MPLYCCNECDYRSHRYEFHDVGQECPRCDEGLLYVPSEPPATIDDLAMLVRRLARRVRKHDPSDEVAAKAMDYIKRKGLGGSPLRG